MGTLNSHHKEINFQISSPTKSACRQRVASRSREILRFQKSSMQSLFKARKQSRYPLTASISKSQETFLFIPSFLIGNNGFQGNRKLLFNIIGFFFFVDWDTKGDAWLVSYKRIIIFIYWYLRLSYGWQSQWRAVLSQLGQSRPFASSTAPKFATMAHNAAHHVPNSRFY